jgi:hypothetical protein
MALGRKIINANGQHLVTTATNNDDKRTSYANKADEVRRHLRQGGPQPRCQPPLQRSGYINSSCRIRTACKLELASPALSRQFINNLFAFTNKLLHACIYFCV